jgi:hypothetical protein
MIIRITLAALAAAAVFTGAACTVQDPCATLPAPTAQESQAAASGAEVEREVGDTECELEGERWAQETET